MMKKQMISAKEKFLLIRKLKKKSQRVSMFLTPEKLQQIIKELKEYLKVPKDGHTPTTEELTEIIRPLIPIIPEVKDGYTPKKGVDYFDGKNGRDGLDGLDGKDGLPGKQGEVGKDGSPDTPEQIATKVNTLEEVILIKTIKGLRNELEKIKKEVIKNNRVFGSGGGDIVQAGTGITIAHTGGKKVISASSAGPITVTGTKDDSNVDFVATSIPQEVVVNGSSYINGEGVTISGTTITLDNPVGVGGSIYAR